MTQLVAKSGCISKSLDKFLKIKTDEKRKKDYGNVTAAKYYERIIKEVKASFEDHKNIITRLIFNDPVIHATSQTDLPD